MQSVAEWESFFNGFKANLAPFVYDGGESLTITEEHPTVHPEQTAWARQMRRGIYMPVEGRVYVAVGYQLCSPTMVVGDDGVIIIDPGFNDAVAGDAFADLRRFSDLPVKAVVYTHRHPDHCFAIKGLGITEADVSEGRVQVIAHETFVEWLINDSSLIAPILGARSSLATVVPNGPEGAVHGGLGSLFSPGPVSTIMPTLTVGESRDVEIAGVRMHLFAAYGDAQDEIDLWFPDLGHVHGSETIQGETFPNLYTLRGTSYRDVEAWREGVDRLLAVATEASSYSGSHMRPWVGNEFIVERITNYRDAIQFLHDQSVRHMNKGYTRDELVDAVAKQLPPHLEMDPWLQPYYGTPEHSVKAIYDGLLGWYQGDPTELAVPEYHDRAARYVDALGGRDAVLGRAREAINAGDHGWAMDLLTHLVRVDTSDEEARRLKAEAMRQWGFGQKNMYWRNLALGGAAELEDTIDDNRRLSFEPPDILRVLPPVKLVERLRVQIDPARATDAHHTVGFRFTDDGVDCAIEVRRGVAVMRDVIPDDTAATVVTTAAAAREIIASGQELSEILDHPATSIEGKRAAADLFFTYFDMTPPPPVKLVVR
ncbi:alkyl sulfatase dimerization domain-containing protein [Microbacterium oxydans]|uniref:alkyl sulfatase dimerization domain-containing protein n=1 Tax=Microbacterium oxydans TaxID=82380 RepID=UPI0024AD0B34|nr:alkyl sulfatase dimerization domain-containing protein [Microbacterium oxydans]